MGTKRRDFEEFYRSTKDECLVTVLVSVGDRETAQELVAEAFARAWASWHKVSRHSAPQAWVVRTALNHGISRWRQRRHEVAMAAPWRIAQSPREAELSSTIEPDLLEALLHLPTRQREVVALRLLMALDTARTAEVLGIAPGTVQAHMGRALATLRQELTPERQRQCLL